MGDLKNCRKINLRSNNFEENYHSVGCLFSLHFVSAIDFSSVGNLNSLTGILIAAATIARTLSEACILLGCCLLPAGEKEISSHKRIRRLLFFLLSKNVFHFGIMFCVHF